MIYLKLYENFNKPKVTIKSNQYLRSDNMDEGYLKYKRKEIILEIDGEVVSDAIILLDVELEDFLNKDPYKKKIKENLDELYGNSIYIKRINTYEQKNKGYASIILEHVYKLAKKNGCEYITLDSMPESKDFWINRGFEICNNGLYEKKGKTIRYYNMIKTTF